MPVLSCVTLNQGFLNHALIGFREGVEVNLLGLTFGLDPFGPALKLPGLGRVGFD